MRNIERGVETARQQIELLREYRTRLIADVVTGKLDVRQAAGRLPVNPMNRWEPEERENEVDDLETFEESAVKDLEEVEV